VDLMEIGAGGGSVARVSRMGTLQVGPDSAGAAPGPACYGLGGDQPCVTDADLLLGYLDADYFLGGEMKLDREAATRAIEEQIATPLDVPLMQAVWGIHDLINETMAAAAKTHIAEKGGNPKVVTVAAFGGAGPLHAYGLARKLGARRLMVPPNAGVGSALGFFTAPRAFDLVRSHKVALQSADFAAVEAIFAEMEASGARMLRMGGEDGEVLFERSVDARFVGQGSETNVPIPEADFAQVAPEQVRRRFDRVYEKLYGRTYPDSKLELVSFRVRASLPHRPLELQTLEEAPGLPEPGSPKRAEVAVKGTRQAFCGVRGEFVPHTVYDRYLLPPEAPLMGPAVIEERESTVVVGSGAGACLDGHGFLWITLPTEEVDHD